MKEDNKNIKISIIIPVYGVEKYIRQCLESVINQTYKNLEIIIVNDGTEDSSMKIVEEYLADERIKVINKENGGLSSARNRGLEEVTGDYILFVDSDDWLKLNMIEGLILNIKDEDIIIFKYYYFDNKNNITIENNLKIYHELPKELKGKEFLYHELPYSCWSKIYKKEYLKRNRFKFLEILYEDIFWNLETLCLTSNIKFLDKFYYYYRINREDSIMQITRDIENKNYINEKFIIKQKKAYIETYKNIEKFIQNNKKKFDSKKILYLLLEKYYWYSKAEEKVINIEESVFLMKKINNFSSKEKEIFNKKFKNILKNKKITKIIGLNLFDKFLWKNKILNNKILRRRIEVKIKNILKS